LRRIYDHDGGGGDAGYRVLVDRLWPRGISREHAAFDEWLKDAAPSTELRRWYGHKVERFEEFARRYRAELQQGTASAAVEHLIDLSRTQALTLLTATRDLSHSGALVLQQHLARPPSKTETC
jgi:uncharacterized protein YeaO (DUF488 family)